MNEPISNSLEIWICSHSCSSRIRWKINKGFFQKHTGQILLKQTQTEVIEEVYDISLISTEQKILNRCTFSDQNFTSLIRLSLFWSEVLLFWSHFLFWLEVLFFWSDFPFLVITSLFSVFSHFWSGFHFWIFKLYILC